MPPSDPAGLGFADIGDDQWVRVDWISAVVRAGAGSLIKLIDGTSYLTSMRPSVTIARLFKAVNGG